MTATYDRPTTATLHVHLANGETWEATPEDLAKFGYVNRHAGYRAFRSHLVKVLDSAGLLDRDLADCELNPIRYLVEVATNYPEDLNDRDMDDTNAAIIAVERTLRQQATVTA